MAVERKLWTPDERLNYLYGMVQVDEKDLVLDFWQDAFTKSNHRFINVLKSRHRLFLCFCIKRYGQGDGPEQNKIYQAVYII